MALNDRTNIVISTVPHESFCLYGFVNGVTVRFLVDTGASVSLLHSDVWHRISASHAALQPWSGPRLVGVDGSELRVCGYVKLALKIGTASVSATPVLQNVPYIGGHLAIFFKSNFTQAYCVLKIILSILCMFHSVYITHRETKIKTKN